MMLTPEQLANLRLAMESGAIADTCIVDLLAHIDAQQARIAELEGAIGNALGGPYYMDHPDGGSVTLEEQLQRMANDAARYRWILHQAWFQVAFDRFDPDDGGMQDRLEKCVAEIADNAMQKDKTT